MSIKQRWFAMLDTEEIVPLGEGVSPPALLPSNALWVFNETTLLAFVNSAMSQLRGNGA